MNSVHFKKGNNHKNIKSLNFTNLFEKISTSSKYKKIYKNFSLKNKENSITGPIRNRSNINKYKRKSKYDYFNFLLFRANFENDKFFFYVRI